MPPIYVYGDDRFYHTTPYTWSNPAGFTKESYNSIPNYNSMQNVAPSYPKGK